MYLRSMHSLKVILSLLPGKVKWPSANHFLDKASSKVKPFLGTSKQGEVGVGAPAVSTCLSTTMGMDLQGPGPASSLEFFLLEFRLLSLRVSEEDFLMTDAEAEADDVLEAMDVCDMVLAISEAGLSPELILTCLLTV